MTPPPDRPKIYHITHVDNLRPIIGGGALLSDAERIAVGAPNTNVGITGIKGRRLEEIEVTCRPGTKVGDYVPFYFCPRSIMLYLLHRGNHPEVKYRGGQKPILHLQADLHEAVAYAEENSVRWAFSDRNAGTFYSNFYCDVSQLSKINWAAVGATDFRSAEVKEGKQAEFLFHRSFPWELIEKVVTANEEVKAVAERIIREGGCSTVVSANPAWYY